MNETLNTIKNRYSCRNYTGEPIEPEKIEAIALAGVQAPSSMNNQPWKIIAVTNKELIDEMNNEGLNVLEKAEDKSAYERIKSRGGKLFYNAPAMFLVLKKAGKDLDCGIVSANISLAATSLGLGNVICAMTSIPLNSPNGAIFKEKLGINEDWEFGMSILVGITNDQGTPHTPDITKIHYIK
jgi:Nitroreductase